MHVVNLFQKVAIIALDLIIALFEDLLPLDIWATIRVAEWN